MSVLQTFVKSPLFGIVLTLATFALARTLFHRTRLLILHPVLVSIVVIIAVLRTSGVSYADYMRGGSIITFLLGPAVVALGLPLYEELRELRKNAMSISVAVLFGSLVGVLSAALPAALSEGGRQLIASLAPKSVTTPIAMDISGAIGGIPSLTASVVVLTGVFGAVLGPVILRLVGITEGIAFGLAMGTASHGIGTARAVETGSVEGAASSLALCLNGIVTSVIAPPLVQLIVTLIPQSS